MSVTTSQSRISYLGDGVTVNFAFPYIFQNNADIQVWINNVQVTTGFTTTGASNAALPTVGGNVAFVSPPPAGAAIVLYRDPTTLQKTVISPNDPFPSKTVETMVDAAMLAIQRVIDTLGRQPTLGMTDLDGAGAYLANGNRIQDLGAPIAETDAATRAFVEASIINSVQIGIGLAPVVDSLAAIRSLSSLLIRRTFAFGHTAVGDGGGGGYYLDLTDHTSADNNGNIIVAADGGRWKLQTIEAVSVKQFGAHADDATDDTLAVRAAVTWAFATGAKLYWPPGTCRTTASIANLHSVNHLGPGAISRGDNTFFVQPVAGQTNNLYCDPVGVNTNDGLSATEPHRVQDAFAALGNYRPVLGGKWVVNLSAGTFTIMGNNLPIGLRSQKLISIRGAPANGGVPTTIMQGAGGASEFAIRGQLNIHMEVMDILFSGVGGTSVAVTERCLLSCRNVHQTNIDQGIVAQDNCQLFVSGGVHQNLAGFGGQFLLQSFFNNKHHIGYYYDDDTGIPVADADLTKAPQFLSASGTFTGAILQENSTGHVFATFQGFVQGLSVQSSSRANLQGGSSGSVNSRFWKNQFGVVVGHGSNIFDLGCDFGVGTANRNTKAAISFQGGADYGQQMPAAPQEYKVGEFIGPGTVTNTTVESMPGGLLYTMPSSTLYTQGSLRLRVTGSITGTANTKRLRLLLGPTSAGFLIFPATAAGSFVAEIGVKATGVGEQMSWGWGICNGALAQTADVALGSLGDGIATTVNLGVTNGSVADATTINFIEVFREG
jgi:hypothetical protein